ncbi:MAG: replication restart helicase PriA [Acidobacteriota bacterium]
MTRFAEVVLPIPLRRSFLYIVPEKHHKKITKGIRVLVPFRKNLLTGYVISLRKQAPKHNIELKEIQEVLDKEPLFSPSFLSFTKRLSDYYFSSWGEILQTSLPPSFAVKTRAMIHIGEKGRQHLNHKSCRGLERKVLNFLTQRPYTESYIRRKFRASGFSSVLSKMKQKGWIEVKRELKRSPEREDNVILSPPSQLEMDYSLDSEMKEKADRIKKTVGKNKFSSFLIFASVKRREAVYLYLIKEAVASGQKTLFLVPEIRLTERILEEFKKKLGQNAAFLHSRLSEKQRELTWKRIKKGEADVVIGPRSILLSSIKGVGLIVLDEEHEDSYYQKENPAYDARIGAQMRAEEEKAVLVYGSENPSVEMLYRSKRGKNLLDLNKDQKSIFERSIIDSRKQEGILSRAMKNKIKKRVEKNEPVLLFFNKHGYASSLVCSRCDYIPKCQNCDVLLTYYKKKKKLICRYCHYSIDLFMKCPECGSDMMLGRGFGIEVLEEELKKSFPKKSIKSLHKFAVKKRNEEEKIIRDYKNGKIDILLGTQMLAHQPELPGSSLVGIFYPESLMRLSDFRAGYKTFRYIREKIKFVKNSKDSEFLVQTYLPNSRPVRCAVFEDLSSFYDHELKNRRLMGYPPFSFLAELLFYGKDLRSVAKKTRKLLDMVREEKNHLEILGPSLAPIKRLRGKNRVQLIIKARERPSLDRALEKIFKGIRTKKSLYIYE